MIFKFWNHLEARNVRLFDRVEHALSGADSCTVCDLCYQFILAEFELMKAEKALAKKLNILNPSKDEEELVFINHFKTMPICLKDHEYLKFRNFV